MSEQSEPTSVGVERRDVLRAAAGAVALGAAVTPAAAQEATRIRAARIVEGALGAGRSGSSGLPWLVATRS